jgi:hypothetical protein
MRAALGPIAEPCSVWKVAADFLILIQQNPTNISIHQRTLSNDLFRAGRASESIHAQPDTVMTAI